MPPVSRPGPQRRDQLQHDVVARDALDALAQEGRVEADLERLAAEIAGQRLAALADLLGLRRDRQLAGRERQPQRRAAGQHLDAGDHVGELGARQRDLVLERLGQQAAELGELPLDAASIRTPERICTLERCDTPRATTWRCLRRSSLGQEIRTADGV